MQEFSAISVSAYDAGSLADRLTEQSAAGWSVVAIVSTGSTVTAYLSRGATGAEAGEAAAIVAAHEAEPEPEVTAEPEPEVTAEAEPEVTAEPEAVLASAEPEAVLASAAEAQAGWAISPEAAGGEPPYGASDVTTEVPAGLADVAEAEAEVAADVGAAVGSAVETPSMPRSDTADIAELAASITDEDLPGDTSAAELTSSAGESIGEAMPESIGASAVAPSLPDTAAADAAAAQAAAAQAAAAEAAAAQAAAQAAAAQATQATASAAPAGWYADPSTRYELRYWDGTQWTEHVSRAGQQYTDPPVA